MKTRFSLRTLLIVVTIAGICLAMLANWIIHVRRQQRLYNEAVRKSVNDGSRLYATATLSVIGSHITGSSWQINGAKLTSDTANAIVDAGLIDRITSSSVPSDEVQAVLALGFEREPDDGQWLTWVRR